MKKIILKCKRYKEIDDCKESVCLHGWLMEIISDQFAEELHQTGTNPLSLQTIHDDETVSFILNLLNEKACSEIEPLIMDDALERIKLRTGEQKEFQILEKRVYEMSEKKLSQIFYANDCNNVLKLKIVTPTAFKTLLQ